MYKKPHYYHRKQYIYLVKEDELPPQCFLKTFLPEFIGDRLHEKIPASISIKMNENMPKVHFKASMITADDNFMPIYTLIFENSAHI